MHYLLLIGAIYCFYEALRMHLEDKEAERQYEEEHWYEIQERERARDRKYRSGQMGKLEATKYEYDRRSPLGKIFTIIFVLVLMYLMRDLVIAVVGGIIILFLILCLIGGGNWDNWIG